MAKKTVRRTASAVSAASLSEQYFNFASFGGINDNKNYTSVSQYTFEDANNVYVDQDSQLHTRPPVRELNIEVFNNDEYCIGLDKVNNITFYRTVEGDTYRWRWKYNGTWYYCHATETSKVVFITDTIVVFNTDSIYGFRWDFENEKYTEYSSEEMVYIPTTDVSQGSSEAENESENIFADGTITRYIFEYGDTLGTSNISLKGETVNVKIGDKTYSVTLDVGTPIVFVDTLTKLSLTNIAVYTSYMGPMLIYDKDSKYIYFSADAETFSLFKLPVEDDSEITEKCIGLAKDGTEIIVVDPTLTKTYEDEDDEDSEYTYTIKVYYMYCTETAALGTWYSIDITILTGYDDSTAMYTNYVSASLNNSDVYNVPDNVAIYHTCLGGNYGYMSIYQDVVSFTIDGISCVNSDEFVFVGHISLQGIHYRYTSSPKYPQSPKSNTKTTATVEMVAIGRVYISSSVLTSSVVFGQSATHFTVTDNLSYISTYRFPKIDTIYGIDYVKADSLSFVVLHTDLSHRVSRQSYNSSTNNITGVDYFVNTEAVIYHAINSDRDVMYKSYGAMPPDDENYNFNSPPSILYCMPIICTRAYQFGSLSFATNDVEYVGESDSDIVTFVDKPYPSLLYFTGGTFNYTHVTYKQSSSQYIHYLLNISFTPEYAVTYDDDVYSTLVNANSDYMNRYTYPIRANASSSSGYNQVTLTKTKINTADYPILYAIYTEDADVLTDKYYYYKSTVYELLNAEDTLIPMYAYRTTLTNSSTYGKILYYDVTDGYTYTNQFEEYATIDIITDGEIHYLVPDFYEDFITTVIVIDNKLYQSTTILDDDDEHPKIYFPKSSEVRFVDKITNIVIFSTTSLGVFLESLVYEYAYSTDNDYYTLTPTKLQLGCKEGADIITSYDGATIYVTNLKGLASLSYEEFVQSDEQVYEYLTENIMSLYDKFKGDNKIKLYQYKDWLWMYRQDSTEIYLYDTRSSTWWKWTLPYPIQKMLYNEEELIFLQSDNRLAKFDFDGEGKFTDLSGNEIEWFFRSQKMHMSYPNHYKHINQLNVITSQDGIELRYKLKFINYHNLMRLSDIDTVCFDIDSLSTLIKRVNFMKTNAFQFEIANDATDNDPREFVTSDIVIKYRITEAIR